MCPESTSGSFISRHIGITPEAESAMLGVLGSKSLNALIDEVVPSSIRSKESLALPLGPLEEDEALSALAERATKNICYRSFIGLGYYGTKSPAVIVRNILQNPAWYTAYSVSA